MHLLTMYQTHLAEESAGIKTYGSNNAPTVFKWKALDAGARAILALDSIDVELIEATVTEYEAQRDAHKRAGQLHVAEYYGNTAQALRRSAEILRETLVAIRETDRNNLPRD